MGKVTYFASATYRSADRTEYLDGFITITKRINSVRMGFEVQNRIAQEMIAHLAQKGITATREQLIFTAFNRV